METKLVVEVDVVKRGIVVDSLEMRTLPDKLYWR
jgi:hypothetical protein